MKPIFGIGISLALVLSLAVSVYAVLDSGQRASGSGSAGAGAEVVLEIDELVNVSELVVLGEPESRYAVLDSGQRASGSGSAGAGAEVVLEIDELVNVSELVVLGEPESSEIVRKRATDTSQPVHLRGADQIIEVSRVTFTVDEYFKGSGAKVISVTMPSASHFELIGTDGTLKEETKYILFLFDPDLRGGGDFWGDTYLTHGIQGTWQVNGTLAERIEPPASLTLDDLRSKARDATGPAQ